MGDLLSVIEIALLIILPLTFFYQRSNWNYKKMIPVIVLLYLFWFSTYALLHELGHYAGAIILNVEVVDFQLIPRFWEGEYKTGYVKSDYENNFQEFVIVILPYLRDLLFLCAGYFIFKKTRFQNLFIAGLILLFFVLSPLYDVTNNYFGFIFGALNDFNALKETSNSFVAHSIGAVFIVFGLLALWSIFRRDPYSRE